jgi:hypothetical protein
MTEQIRKRARARRALPPVYELGAYSVYVRIVPKLADGNYDKYLAGAVGLPQCVTR